MNLAREKQIKTQWGPWANIIIIINGLLFIFEWCTIFMVTQLNTLNKRRNMHNEMLLEFLLDEISLMNDHSISRLCVLPLSFIVVGDIESQFLIMALTLLEIREDTIRL